MNNKLILAKEHFIARGGERECYSHPLDPTKVVKVLYKKDGVYAYNGSRNDLDRIYYNFLKKSKISFFNLTKCYGFANTNLGKGLIFDKVCDYNGKISMALSDVIAKKILNSTTESTLINNLQTYVLKNNILFIDSGLHNILCCEYEKNKYKLVIIDGLGAKRNGFKFWLYLHSSFYTKYKVKKEWENFMKKYKKLNSINKPS